MHYLVPDSQTLSGLNLPRWSLKQHLQDLYDEGILISHHGINTWWEDYKTTPRPKYLHCVPIGLGIIRLLIITLIETSPFHVHICIYIYMCFF